MRRFMPLLWAVCIVCIVPMAFAGQSNAINAFFQLSHPHAMGQSCPDIIHKDNANFCDCYLKKTCGGCWTHDPNKVHCKTIGSVVNYILEGTEVKCSLGCQIDGYKGDKLTECTKTCEEDAPYYKAACDMSLACPVPGGA